MLRWRRRKRYVAGQRVDLVLILILTWYLLNTFNVRDLPIPLKSKAGH